MVGTTPLIVHVPDRAPIRSRRRIICAMPPMLDPIAFSNSLHPLPKKALERMQHTAVEKRRATWLAPDRASVPKMLTLSARSPINTRIGINEIAILFLASLFTSVPREVFDFPNCKCRDNTWLIFFPYSLISFYMNIYSMQSVSFFFYDKN